MNDLPALLKKIARRRVLVVGDIMLDRYLWGDATRISPEAPVPVVHVLRDSSTVGGAANVANNVAALGASVEVVGLVGRDETGNLLRRHLREARIAFDPAWARTGIRTITKTRVLVRNQQLCRLDREESPESYQRAFLRRADRSRLREKVRRADAVIFSDYAKGLLTSGLVEDISGWGRGKFLALDPKPASGLVFHGLDLITPNRKEAVELAKLGPESERAADLNAICAAIWKRYRPRNLVVTLGADGMLISANGRVTKRIDTAARQVYDVSGAGDTVIAALTLAMASDATLEEAAHFANDAAGVVVGKIGTATVTPAELLAHAGLR